MQKPRLSFWQIWNMGFGFLGIQFGWGLQMANMSAIYEYLGAGADQIPILWLAAPLTGLIVQPVIGHMSDRTWNRLGRRRPYFLAGAILSSLALIAMPNSPALWMAAGLLWILDASINISMEPFRAFVADMLPEEQRTSGFAMQSLFIGLGAVVASALPWLMARLIGPDTGGNGIPLTVKLSFYIGSAAFFGAVVWTIASTKEYPPEDLEAFSKSRAERAGLAANAREILASIRAMPPAMRRLAWVQMCTWLGLFCTWLYFPVAVARNIFGAPGQSSPVYTEGIAWGGICLGTYSAVCFVYSFALPAIARRIGRKILYRDSRDPRICCVRPDHGASAQQQSPLGGGPGRSIPAACGGAGAPGARRGGGGAGRGRRRRTLIRRIALLAVAVPAVAAQLQYKAVTDREVRAKPPLPQMGKAGTIIADPAYGTRIVRITDHRTDPEGAPCVTSAAAFQNTWNADSTRLVLMCGGARVFRFDPEKLKARAEGGPVDMRETPAFSYTDPDLIYGIGADARFGTERTIQEYNVRKKKYRTLVDLDRVAKDFEGIPGLLTVSANERMVAPFDGIQDTWHYVLLFDKRTGRQTLLDTRSGAIDGRPAASTLGFGVHLVNIDKSGRYVVISKGQGGKAPNLVVWDTETNRFAEVEPEGAGHYSAGYGMLVNNSGTFPHWAQWMLRSLDPDELGRITPLVVPDPPKDFGGRHEHSSWNNARENVRAPVFVSVTRYAGAPNPPGPWDDEIIAISTAPERPNVFRFAFHRSRPEGDFWDVPRGNISPDGRFFMFTSNWEGTLGRARPGRPRQDVFVLELPPIVQ